MSNPLYPWHVIDAGGKPRSTFVDGVFMVPYFNSHDDCILWWKKHATQNKERSPWAITEKEWVQP